jgi:hypothetical protein
VIFLSLSLSSHNGLGGTSVKLSFTAAAAVKLSLTAAVADQRKLQLFLTAG